MEHWIYYKKYNDFVIYDENIFNLELFHINIVIKVHEKNFFLINFTLFSRKFIISHSK